MRASTTFEFVMMLVVESVLTNPRQQRPKRVPAGKGLQPLKLESGTSTAAGTRYILAVSGSRGGIISRAA